MSFELNLHRLKDSYGPVGLLLSAADKLAIKAMAKTSNISI